VWYTYKVVVAVAPFARTPRRLLLDRRFGPFVLARLCAGIGVWIHAPIAAIEMYRLTGSAVWVGLVGVVQFAPQVLLAPILGILADRGHARLQIVLGYVVSAVGALLSAPAFGGAALLPVLALSDAVWLLVGAAVVGIGFSIGGPAGLAMVAELVDADEVPAATQLNSLPLLISRTAGPALGAVLLAGAGAGACFALSGGVNLAAALVMAVLGLPRRLPGAGVAAALGLGTTVRYVLAHRELGLTLMGIAVVGAASDPSTTLTPILGDRVNAPAAAAGWMAAAFGLGSLLAVPLVTPLRRWQGLFGGAALGLALMAVGLATTAVPLLAAAMAGMTIAGIGMTVGYTCFSILVQLLSPAAMRARVFALWIVAFLGLRPIMSLLSGGGVEWVGVVPVLALVGTGGLAVAARCWVRRGSVTVEPSWAVRDERACKETS